MKKLKIFLIAIAVIIAGGVAYIQGNKYIAKTEVEEYLASEGIDAVAIEPFMANLPGGRNFLVSVELQNDDGHYYYYYDRENKKVVLESYVLNGVEYAEAGE